MNVTREVILDLLPVYLSGDASPATRALVEEYMKQDSELAQRVRLQWAENLAKVVAPHSPFGSRIAVPSPYAKAYRVAAVAV